MKKTLLAAALIVGFAGVAQAETSVTLYGILDGGIGYQDVNGTLRDGTNVDAKRIGLINGIQSGNRWGLKGSEDLGSGLRAVFQLESGFDLGRGTSSQGNRLFGRQATVGLAGDSWGQLDLGRQTNIASKYLPGVADPFGAGFEQANIGAAFTAANTARYDNMVMYQTPNYSGFQFGIGYSFNVNNAQSFDREVTVGGETFNLRDQDQKAFTTGLRYANGPIGAALTYDQVKSGERRAVTASPGVPAGTLLSEDTLIKSWNLGFSYDFEVVKLHLAAGQTKDGLLQTQTYANGAAFNDLNVYTAYEGLKINSYLVGLTAPIGNGNLLASWHMADPTDRPDAAVAAGQDWDKQNTFSLGYTYGLSKRTNVYAIGSYAKHVHFLPDADSTLVGIGIRHQF